MLTAGHVLRDQTGPIIARHAAGSKNWSCTVVWHDADADAALLRIDTPDWTEPPGLPPIAWGLLATERGEVRFELSGFPSGMAARRADQSVLLRDTAHGAGSLDARADADGLLRGTLDHPIPPSPQGELRWKGASGAGATVEGCLVGIVVREAGTSGRRLLIVPVTTLLERPGFLDHVGPVACAPAELQPILTTEGPRQAHSPVSLLAPEAEAVQFHGRDAVVAELTSWRDEPSRFSVRLVTGQGGQGKTRLARHLIALARERGWSAGSLADRVGGSELAMLDEVTTPLLLVVDYAEDRFSQLVELATVLRKALARRPNSRIRLVLLARAQHEWWPRLQREVPLLRSFSVGTVLPLPPLEPTAAARSTALRAAVADLSARIHEVVGHPAVVQTALSGLNLPDVSGERFACALNLQITGLITVLQAVDPVDVTKDEDDEAILLRHEQKFWKRTAARFGLDGLGLAARRRLVGAAALCQADDRDEAQAVLLRMNVAPELRDGTARWLSSLYPAWNAYWGPLVPDRVGEYLISVVISDDPDLLPDVVPHVARRQALRALRVLARADIHRSTATAIHDLITGHSGQLATVAVEAATTVEHPAPLRRALETVTLDADAGLLSLMYDATPLQSQALEEWAAVLADRLAQAARAAFESRKSGQLKADLARRLNEHAVRLQARGRHREALLRTTESVSLRQTAVEDPADLHRLVISLNTHVNALTETGDLLGAREAADELVRLSKKSARFDPADLPMALYGLSIRAGDLGDHPAAVDAAVAALRHYRQLARNDPEAYRPDVALALGQVALSSSEAGHHEEAVRAAHEAVGIYRELAVELPDAYSVELARVIGTLASTLRASGRSTEAAVHAEESTRLHRRILKEAPDADPTWLCGALTTYAETLFDAGEEAEALRVFREVVSIRRLQYETTRELEPTRYAEALYNEALALCVIDEFKAALASAEQAVQIRRKSADFLPRAHGPSLAVTLNVMTVCLLGLDRADEALATADEAVSTCRRLNEIEPETHLDQLVDALAMRADALQAADDVVTALTDLDEAVSWQRRLVRHDPSALPSLVKLLTDFAHLLAQSGDLARAVSVAEECVLLARRPQEDVDVTLATALNEYAIVLSNADQRVAMLPASEEAYLLWRALAKHEPEQHSAGLGTSVHLLSVCLVENQRADEALRVVKKHLKFLNELAAEDPEVYLPMQAHAQVTQAAALIEIGKARKALTVADQALAVFAGSDEFASDAAAAEEERVKALSALKKHDLALLAADAGLRVLKGLAEADPVLHNPYLASMLRVRAEALAAAGATSPAIALADAAVALYSQLVSDHPGFFGTELESARRTRREVSNDR
ncbi:hypothetical protein [Lentzea sp. NPDC092896]|uniref:hypothetical protein n=1 Tax=Lentzea sp. NPDC092896 TaxID=3364127 RepID=UPI003829A83B